MTRGILKYSDKTWHYRLMLWTWCWNDWEHKVNLNHAYRLPDNLCPYMRQLLIVTIPLAIPLYIWRKMPGFIQDHKDITRAVIITTIMVHTIVHLINFLLIGSNYEPYPWWAGWLGIGIIWGGIVGVVGIILGIGALWDFIKCKTDINVGKPSTMCLVEDYFEAKHDKICPRLEFVSDEKDEDKKD